MSSDYIYYRSIVNVEDTQDTDALEESGEEKNDNVDTEKIDGEEGLATLLDETESPSILECATPSHSLIMHDTTVEDGVLEHHRKDLLKRPDRQTLEHESQDGGHDTIHTEEQIATGILFADTLTQSLNKCKIKGKEIFKWDGSFEDLKSWDGSLEDLKRQRNI